MDKVKKNLRAICLSIALALIIPLVCQDSFAGTTAKAASMVKINKTNVTLYVGKSTQLSVKGTKKKVIWKSSNKKVATVSSKGKVTGKKKGTAKITATVAGNKYCCNITIKDINLKSISLNKTSLTLDIDDTYVLKVKYSPTNTTVDKKVIWSSSDKSIVNVDKYGKVCAYDVGTAVITAKVGNIKQTCKVTVNMPVIPVTDIVADDEYTIRMESKKTINVTYLPLDANEIFQPTFKSLDTSIIIVSQTGELTPVTVGEASVEVKFRELFKTIKIVVLESKEKLIEAENARYKSELDELYNKYYGLIANIMSEIEYVKETKGYYYGTEYDYRTEVSDLTDKIVKVQKQIASYSVCNSQEDVRRLQKLKESLNSYETQLKILQDKWSGTLKIDLLDQFVLKYIEEYYDNVDLAKSNHIKNINEINAGVE